MSKRVAMIAVVAMMVAAHVLWFPGRRPGTIIRPRNSGATRPSPPRFPATRPSPPPPTTGASPSPRPEVPPSFGGARDPFGGADDLRDVPDGERAGDSGAGERVLHRPVGVPQQLERGGAPVPLPGHPGRREPDAAEARGPRPDDVPPYRVWGRAPAAGSVHLLPLQ
jgi:hypothetical protein